MEKDIKNIISDSLKINGGEYREIRIEENNSTRITYRGDSRENISISKAFYLNPNPGGTIGQYWSALETLRQEKLLRHAMPIACLLPL